MQDPLFYIVEIDLPAAGWQAQFATFRRWYAHVHAPHLYEAGFATCTSYRAVAGAMEIVDIYQAPAWEVFEGARFAAYRAIAAADPHLPGFMPAIANIRTPYGHVAWGGRAAEKAAWPLAADWITVWRLAADDALLSRTAGWLDGGGEAAFAAAGASAVRLLNRTRSAPTGTSDRPQGALVLEWKAEPPPAFVTGEAAPVFLKGAMTGAPHFCGYRLYPWPDDAALLARE